MVRGEKRERTKGKSKEWVEGKRAGRAKWWGQRTVNNAGGGDWTRTVTEEKAGHLGVYVNAVKIVSVL